MTRWLLKIVFVAVLLLLGSTVLATDFYITTDVPTDLPPLGGLTYLGEDGDYHNINSSQFTAAEAVGTELWRNDVVSLGVDGVLSDSLLWTMRMGADRIESPERPTSGDVETIAHYNWDLYAEGKEK